MQGRRRPDTAIDRLPDDLQPGDYWKCTAPEDERPVAISEPTNLTGTMWEFVSPIGGVGTLTKHTVRENDDNTISVLPGDGSSNSILYLLGGSGRTWHGYIYNGVWKEV